MCLRQKYGYLASPAFVYSLGMLRHNVRDYKDTLGPRGVLSYSLKANSNPGLLVALRDAGVTMATTVSGNEVLMALHAGFLPRQVILNGNGKRRWEVELAVRHEVLLNVDSVFDAQLLVDVVREVGVRARALVRLNPVLDAHTHPYLATALRDSKFGVEERQLLQVLKVLGGSGASGHVDLDECVAVHKYVSVEGVHVHVGSAITQIQVYVKMMQAASLVLKQIQEYGWKAATIINLGGGLNVFYDLPTSPASTMPPPATMERQSKSKETAANSAVSSPVTADTSSSGYTPQELIEKVLPYLPEGATLVLEPGRSLVASAGVVMTEVLGVKTNGGKEYVVVDAAMTEVIRPALYHAHHPITYVTPPAHQPLVEVDVVGPVCESSDFLARRCLLQRPPAGPGVALVVWRTGAYCSSMASNYNLRPHALEVMVHGPESYKVLRRPQEFQDLLREIA
ncbi:uncharacterized protein [Cherax quadricarinatus]|nr:uncharacterized protein LOC128702332 isoform X2 [Cherax quadricarinatus]